MWPRKPFFRGEVRRDRIAMRLRLEPALTFPDTTLNREQLLLGLLALRVPSRSEFGISRLPNPSPTLYSHQDRISYEEQRRLPDQGVFLFEQPRSRP